MDHSDRSSIISSIIFHVSQCNVPLTEYDLMNKLITFMFIQVPNLNDISQNQICTYTLELNT